MTHERMRAIAQRCVEDIGVPDGLDLQGATDFVAAAIETALEEAGRPVDISLRDRFAMVALGALIGRGVIKGAGQGAYDIADDVLEAGKR